VSTAKVFLASVVWLLILSVGVIVYRFWLVPSAVKQQAQAQREVLDATSGDSKYKHRIKLGLDGFTGYAVLRSPEFTQELRTQSIKIEAIDDGANYEQRLAALASGELQLAAFPIDALLKACARTKTLPATIVAILDESRGADAVVAYKQRYPNVEALLSSDAQFVLVDGSPSDTLARLLLYTFNENVTPQSIVTVKSEKELVDRYRKATPGGNEIFVTWEPVVSELLKNDQMHVLFDSSKRSSYIVDALVVNRDFLLKNEPVVRQVLECYFRSLYAINNDPIVSGSDPQAKLKTTVLHDAQQSGTAMTSAQAERLLAGVVWKNTQDNFAHFGLGGGTAVHIEDMIDRIRLLLMETKGIDSDPTQGDSSRLFNQQALREMQSSGFHAGANAEAVQSEAPLAPLTAAQWDNLLHVATLRVPPLIFARSSSVLTDFSEAILDDLAEQLKSFPLYYLTITGNAGSKGDAQANRELAKQRAAATLQYLTSKGIPAARMRTAEGEVRSEMSVTFRLGQLPF
jgi:outer membrane protein OmpA-like peptidoglycan-associated protein